MLAGVVAGIGFSLHTGATVPTALAAFAYVVPLILIGSAYMTKVAANAPTATSLRRHYPNFPINTFKFSSTTMVEAYEQNQALHDRKAKRFDRAFVLTILVTILVLFVQLITAWSTKPNA